MAPSLPLINSTAQLEQPTIVTVNFDIVDDSIGLEDEEVMVVQLRVVDPDPSGFQVNLAPLAETEVAVLDNECKTHTQPSTCAFWEGCVCGGGGEVRLASPPYICTSFSSPVVRIGFQQLAYTVSEAAGSVEVCAVASSTTIRPINFTVDTQNGTALGKLGYLLSA